MAVTSAEGDAQAAAAGVGEREHGQAGAPPRRRARAPSATAGAAPVSTSMTATSRSASAPATRPVHDLAVGARDRDLVAAQHVRVGEHRLGGDDDAGAAAPAAAEPDHGGADPLAPRDRRLQLVQTVICSSVEDTASCRLASVQTVGVTCYLQVAT